jgi:hypothetical protein
MSTASASLSFSATSAQLAPSGPSTTRASDGTVHFENDNYRIRVTDNGTVHIFNKSTGEDYRIWGDPHVHIDGEHAFDFWGQTTFVLDDGTKVTIETTPWQGRDDATIASVVTIVDDTYASQITGVDDNAFGDLAFTEYDGLGVGVDLAVRDGNVLYENAFGSGFLAVDGQGRVQSVDQEFINGTDEFKNAGLDGVNRQAELARAFAPMLGAFSGIVAISFGGAFLAGFAAGILAEPREPRMTHGLPPVGFQFVLAPAVAETWAQGLLVQH